MEFKWLLVLLGAVALMQCTWAVEEEEEEDHTVIEGTDEEDEDELRVISRVRRQSSSSCRDVLDYCKQWPDHYCKVYKEYMKTKCAKKCGYCSNPTVPPACRDKQENKHCPGWKKSKFCAPTSQWYSYMKINCPKTCGFCNGGGGGGGGGGGQSCTAAGASRKIKGCKFDSDTCDWYQVPFDDKGDFELKSGSAANGGSGGFLSATQTGSSKLVLPLELVLPHGANYGSMCLRFHYKGNGGIISVYEIANTRGARQTVRKRIRLSSSSWACARVPVSVGITNQLMIEAVVGRLPINIDDISFADRC